MEESWERKWSGYSGSEERERREIGGKSKGTRGGHHGVKGFGAFLEGGGDDDDGRRRKGNLEFWIEKECGNWKVWGRNTILGWLYTFMEYVW